LRDYGFQGDAGIGRSAEKKTSVKSLVAYFHNPVIYWCAYRFKFSMDLRDLHTECVTLFCWKFEVPEAIPHDEIMDVRLVHVMCAHVLTNIVQRVSR